MSKRITLEELKSYLWNSAVLLRTHIDAGSYKQYIFPLLFFKRISDVYDEECAAILEEYGDEEALDFPENHRFAVPKGYHWRDVRSVAENVGVAIINAYRAIERANAEKLQGVFGDGAWTNKNRLPDELLKDLIEHFSTLTLSIANCPEDELGQGYEYLIRKFADDSGHTAQEFYTNRTVVHLMTEMLKPESSESIYDPTCGSAGMLISAIVHLKAQGKEWRNVKIYGQEINALTSAIARMNLFLHGVKDFYIVNDDTLMNPAFIENNRLMTFDIVVANPPYSIKAAVAPFDGICSGDITVIEAIPEKLLPELLPFVIQNDTFFDYAVGKSADSLSPRAKWEHLQNFEFTLPPVAEQRKLADLLWAVNAARTAYKKLLVATDELIKSQFIEMFGDLGSNPMNWKQIRLIDTCAAPDDIKCGPFGTQLCRGEYQKSGVALWGIPQINSAFQSGTKDFLTDKKAAKLEAYSLQPGDIAMSRKGNVGMCALFPEHFPIGIIHSDVLRIRPNTKVVNPVFLMSQLHYSPIVETQIGMVSNGAIMAGINVTKLKTISVHIPPLDLQTRFADFVQQADKSKFVAL